tara:strand:+ start:1317 stop:1544 length:228 start_codon:yes stop_codon:yes gene_type:complete
MIRKTTDDGWSCVEELTEVAVIMDSNKSILYEINNCVRASDLRDIVSVLRESYVEAIASLDAIDLDIEYKTIYED